MNNAPTKYMMAAGRLRGLNTAPRQPLRINDVEIDIDGDCDGTQEPTPDHAVIPMAPTLDDACDPCPHCRGRKRCPECGGSGDGPCYQYPGTLRVRFTCEACNGTGQCPECSGDLYPSGDGEDETGEPDHNDLDEDPLDGDDLPDTRIPYRPNVNAALEMARRYHQARHVRPVPYLVVRHPNGDRWTAPTR